MEYSRITRAARDEGVIWATGSASAGIFDHASPVSERYGGSFPFTGEIHEVVIELGAPTPADTQTAARTEMARQ